MGKIKNTKQFKEQIDAALETMKTRDEAKACYDFEREEYKNAETEICAYAGGHPEVFEGRDGTSGWGTTDTAEYVISSGRALERADGGKLTDGDFLQTLPKKYLRVKFEINKAKIKADGLDADDLAKLGLVSVITQTLKLKPRG